MSNNNTLTAPAQVAAPVTYADIVNSAQTLKLTDVCDVNMYDKLPQHLQTVIMADLVKRVNVRKQEALGEVLTSIDTLIQQTAPDILTQIRELMSTNDITTVNVRITADSFGIVKQLDKPASTRTTGTTSRTSKYTYYVNDTLIVGGSSDVATALGIDVTTDQYKKANGWLKIAVQAKSKNAIITRTNVETNDVEQFAPEATTKEAHAVWFKQS